MAGKEPEDHQDTHNTPIPKQELPSQELKKLETQEVNADWNPDKEKAESARSIAKGILIIFGVSLLVILVYAAIVTITLVSSAGDNSPELFLELFTSMIDATAGFASTVFGPLLAFILGYYFATDSQTGSS